ncbi:MAG: hypothetical protein LCH52_08440 [Bacteroidetes bacterium]|nr:hypothetical protein [Bacteroidota bacterium]
MELIITTGDLIYAGALVLFLIIGVLAYALLKVNCIDTDDEQIYEFEIKNKALRASIKTGNETLVESDIKIDSRPVSRRNSGISDHTSKKAINHNSTSKRRLKW